MQKTVDKRHHEQNCLIEKSWTKVRYKEKKKAPMTANTIVKERIGEMMFGNTMKNKQLMTIIP